MKTVEKGLILGFSLLCGSRVFFVYDVPFILIRQRSPLFSSALVTSPSFCTTASERVYITTSSDNANGGSQGAVGDRRAAICGANVAGAGAL